jgi:hypothetical protein
MLFHVELEARMALDLLLGGGVGTRTGGTVYSGNFRVDFHRPFHIPTGQEAARSIFRVVQDGMCGGLSTWASTSLWASASRMRVAAPTETTLTPESST